ncbi:MAG TPA: AAA family ATPase [Thermoanaerobaculia bacterium]|nr:AAA family ATPase [Thermoanaerobaculia bacterium]
MTAEHLEIRLLGGFQVSRAGRTVDGFESQKVRALLAYLATQRGRSFSRDHLASLLWPEEGDEAARRNFRQALYDLRRTLERARPGGGALLESSHRTARLSEAPGLWIDVEAFEARLDRAGSGGASDPLDLAAAARLYEGDLLAGFHVEESPEFEEWLVTEQERLRERAIAALLALVDHHLESGTYSLGVEYGRRLVRIDPLSESAHRKLMRLHAFSGRRSRAIARYQELTRLLDEELGVEPAAETTAEYRAIVAEELPDPAVREKAEPVGPLVPLVGREDALARLRETWAAVRGGAGRLTRVVGESGVGKTRLVKTFVHEATSAHRALVLQGRYHELAPPVAFLGFVQAFGDAVTHEVEVAETLVGALDRESLAELALLVPALHELRPGLGPAASGRGLRTHLFEAVARAFVCLTRPRESDGERQPVVLFLDDLQAADPSSLELLAFLRDRLAAEPVWILTASTGDEGLGGGEALELGRLDREATARIAAALVPDRAEELAGLLGRGGGLPLAITELINYLWDEGFLVERRGGSWSLEEAPEADRLPDGVDRIALARLEALPSSTRRLFTLAAVAGPEFDADLLRVAEREHGTVVETGIQVLLERWLGRLRLGYWADSRKQRDLTLWTAGPRHGTFEFSHPSLREAIYRALDEERRALLHRRVAEALETRWGPQGPQWRSEVLAYHHFLGRAWERALPHLQEAAANALRVGAEDTAAYYLDRAAESRAALERERAQS